MDTLRKLLLVAPVPLVLLLLGGSLRAQDDRAVDRTLRDLKVLSETLELVRRYYVEDVGLGQLQRGAFQGLAESLDPWSSYWDPERMQALAARDASANVGLLLLKPPQQYVRVVTVVPGSPAAAAGLEPGRHVETIDGLATKDLTLLEAEAMLAGPPGSTVELGLFRESDEGERPIVVLARRDLHDLRVVVTREGEDAAVLRVTDVRQGAAALAAARLSELSAAGVDRLVLDLRACLGGSMDEARALADLFVEPGPLFSRRDRAGDQTVVATTAPSWTGRLVVLAGPGTVGEAELVVAALQARSRATVVGLPTFGKRYAQDLVRLSDGSGLSMSVAEYRDAKGEAFPRGGLKPDERVAPARPVEVVRPDDEEAAADGEDDDATLRADEREPTDGEARAAEAGGTGPELPDPDPQLERALELLRGAEPAAGASEKAA
jgi:carboxyl-terminal processing protease